MVGAKSSLYTVPYCPEHTGYLIHLCHLLRHFRCLALSKRFRFFSFIARLSSVCPEVAEVRGSNQHH